MFLLPKKVSFQLAVPLIYWVIGHGPPLELESYTLYGVADFFTAPWLVFAAPQGATATV